MNDRNPLVQVRDVSKDFPGEKVTRVTAVRGVTFDIMRGETFALAGESGGGKTTVGRMILGLTTPTAGHVIFDGQDIAGLSPRAMRPLRRRMQMVFQNPLGALNPRKTVGASLELPLINFAIGSAGERRGRVAELLEMVGLETKHAERYPHEFSGGQAQRIGIARALALEPDFVFLDEPVSALDVSIQAQILNLLKDLQDQLGLTYLFVAHNLNVVQFMGDRTAVMRDGEIVEMGSTKELFRSPKNEYTRKLLSAVLQAESR
jgi:ABC-type oligopeptide transport system ATPase subunit